MVKGRNIIDNTRFQQTEWYIVLATDDDDISEGPSDRSPPQSVPVGKVKC